MAFMYLGIFFSKKKTIINQFFFFVCILHSFINARLHKTLSVFEEGAIKHISSAELWLYGFESVFQQVLIDFLFVV